MKRPPHVFIDLVRVNAMAKIDDLQRVLDTKLMAVIRAPSGERVVEIAEALLAGGVDIVEVTFTVPRAHHVLEKVVDKLSGKMLIGAGTVLDTETARTAILAGAQFIVSPTLNLDVIRLCNRYDTLVLPGALTPTEILTAWEAGADIVKVFPADFVGPGYFKALHGPLPQLRLMPTSGVNLQTASEFLKAGACALGAGSPLVEPAAVAAGNMQRITDLARQFVEVVKPFRRSERA